MAKWLCLSLLVLLSIVPLAAAQMGCPALVDAALSSASEVCTDLGRNQACYGNVTLDVTPREDAPEFTFEQAGDVVDIANIDSLRLSSMSITDEIWGIALMRIQANLPDTLPGQNVTVLLFGDVQLTNTATPLTELEVSATAAVNVRLRPTTDENNVIASVARGETITANGRLEDSSWIRVVSNADTGELGWLSADFVTGEEDLDVLTVVEAGEPLFGPMQAFYFSSGIGDRACAEAPDSGLLIQTPQGAGEVTLRVNEVDIRLGSTVYLQAQPGGVMTVSVVEGHAVVSSNGVSQAVPAGTYSEIPLDTNGTANSTPTYPQPYDFNALQALPVDVALPVSISVAPAIEPEELQTAIDIANGLPLSGNWELTWHVLEDTVFCDTRDDTGSVWSTIVVLAFSEDRQTLSFADDWSSDSPYAMSPGGANAYRWGDGLLTLEVTFTGATTFSIQWNGIYGDPATGGCGNYIMEGTATYRG